MLRTLSVVLLGLAVAGTAVAEDALVKYRHNHMKVLGGHMGSIVAVVKGEVPFSDQLLIHAQGLAANAAFVKTVFEKPAEDPKSHAKPAIWTEWGEFSAKADALKTAADKLAQAAAAGDQGEVRGLVGEVGRACKSCHDSYKADH